MSQPVIVERIEIIRMPGFEQGGFSVDDLSPGVNVIYGPNASGKTTLAHAMQRMLRPADFDSHRDEVRGNVVLGDQSYRVAFDFGSFKCEQEGREATLPKLASAELGGHYLLELNKLIQSTDGDNLAGKIQREATGGYDVQEVGIELEYQPSPQGGRKQAGELKQAIKNRKDAARLLNNLTHDEDRLVELNRRRDKSREAREYLDWIEKAAQHAGAQGKLEEERIRVNAFDPRIEKLQGNEVKQWEQLEDKIKEDAVHLSEQQTRLQEAEEELAKSKLPAEGIPVEQIGALRLRCKTLRTLEEAGDRASNERTKTKEEVQRAAERLGVNSPQEDQPLIESKTLDDLFEFVEKAEGHRSNENAESAIAAWLGANESTEDPQRMEEALRLIDRWQSAQVHGEGNSQRLAWYIFAAASGCLAILLGLFVHSSWFALLLLAAALFAWGRFRSSRIDELDVRHEFSVLDVEPPDSWTPPSVGRRVRELRDEWSAAALVQEKKTRWSQLANRREEIEKDRHRFAAQRENWKELLGIDMEDDVRLYLFASKIEQWQKAKVNQSAAEVALKDSQKKSKELLEEINKVVVRLGGESVKSSDSAEARVESLDGDREKHKTAIETCAATEQSIEKLEKSLSETRETIKQLFIDIDLSPEEGSTLRRWIDQHKGYRDANDALREAETVLKVARERLAADEPLLSLDPASLESERDKANSLASEYESTRDEITTINTRIKDAKEATHLEQALAQEAACREALRAARLQDQGTVVGHLLIEHLQRQQGEHHQPAVYRRARALFTRFTHGRYELHVEPGPPPRFRAEDTSLDQGQELDELSSGTRLQLLLAVRIAFIESQEQGYRLPIVLDEALGNSDEWRAAEVIAAVIEIARDGRQVFYLTAQYDELGKWRRALEGSESASCEKDLAKIRNFSEAERAPLAEFEMPKPAPVPSPDGCDWLEYGRNKLNVPSFDPSTPIGGIHLWYVMEEVDRLHKFLQNDVNKWGQFKTLVEGGFDQSIHSKSPLFQQAAANARAIEELARHWKIGRGKPVLRSVLKDSPVGDSKFFGAVSDLAGQLEGDAQQLMESLRSKSIKGIRSATLEDLEGYLIEKEYLDPRPILSPEEVKDQAREMVFSDIQQGTLSSERFSALASLVAHAGSVQDKI